MNNSHSEEDVNAITVFWNYCCYQLTGRLGRDRVNWTSANQKITTILPPPKKTLPKPNQKKNQQQQKTPYQKKSHKKSPIKPSSTNLTGWVMSTTPKLPDKIH